MEPLVGGRMETVARRPITDPGDRFRLALLVVVAAAVHGWLLNHTFVTARDGIGFARYAMLISHPTLMPASPGDPEPTRPRTIRDVFKEQQQPPGFPLAVYATSLAVKAAYHPGGPHELQDQMLYAVQLAAAVGGVLLVFPTYWLGRSLFGKFAGFSAALLFQVLPVPAHVTADGLTEGVYLFTLATALLLGVRAVNGPSVGRFLQCGLATGIAYLVRPEGAFVGAACAGVIVAMALLRRWQVRAAAGWGTALAVGGLLAAAPYMALIGGVSNKPSAAGLFEGITNPKLKMLQDDGKKTEAPAGATPALFGTWIPADSTGVQRAAFAAKAVVKEAVQGIFYVPLLWAAAGLYAVRRQFRTDPRFWLIGAFVGMTLVLLLALGSGKGYVSERHTLPLVFVGCLFFGAGLEPLGRWFAAWRPTYGLMASVGGPRLASVWVLAAIVAVAIPGALKPLHEHRVGHKHAGEFLAREGVLDKNDVLVDPFEWAQFYCGRTLYGIPPDPAPCRARWAVLEKSKTEESHTLLTRIEEARNIARDGRSVVAYTWPENVPPAEAEVVVYRLEVPN